MSETAWNSPETFSAEVHFALLSQGLRGPLLRRLMRLARADAELSRIFEAKVSEYRRYVRQTRTPTLWNLPMRAWEWLSDQARFTPPREVLMTLVYVVLAMMGMEFVKTHFLAPTVDDRLHARALSLSLGELPAYRGPVKPEPLRLDQQMIDELQRAANSEVWRKALAAQLAESLTSVDVEPLLRRKLEAILASPEFADRIAPRPSPPKDQPSLPAGNHPVAKAAPPQKVPTP